MHYACSVSAGANAISGSTNQIFPFLLCLFSFGPGGQRLLLLFSYSRRIQISISRFDVVPELRE